jgi:hypothetical protein
MTGLDFSEKKNRLFLTYTSVLVFVQRQNENAWGLPDVFTEGTASESMLIWGGLKLLCSV